MTINDFQIDLDLDGDQAGSFRLTVGDGDDITVVSACDADGAVIDINMTLQDMNDLITTLSTALAQALKNKLDL